jgi:hypothetical protein
MTPVSLVNSIVAPGNPSFKITTPEVLDTFTPPIILAGLSYYSGVPYHDLRKMTLAHWVDPIRLHEGIAPSDSAAFNAYIHGFYAVQPPSGSLTKPRLPWARHDLGAIKVPVCRACLIADEIPYIRLPWKFGLVTSCPLHRTKLTETIDLTLGRSAKRNPETPELSADKLFLDAATLDFMSAGAMILPSELHVSAQWWLACLRGLAEELCLACTKVEDREQNAFYRALFRACGNPYHGWVRSSMSFENHLTFGGDDYVFRLVARAVCWFVKGEVRPASGSRLIALCPMPDPFTPPIQI